MGLIKETNAQYYSGQQVFPTLNSTVDPTYSCTFNTDVVSAFDSTGNQIGSASNYTIYIYNSVTSEYEAVSESLSYISDSSTNTITLTGTYTGDTYVELKQFAINNNYGGYAYTT